MDRREAVRKRESGNFLAPPKQLIVSIENECLRTRGFDLIKGAGEVLRAIELFGKNLHTAHLCRLSNGVKDRSVSRKRTIPHHRDPSRAGKGIEQQIKPF